MKVRIDIEVKPEEIRTLIGLPDVSALSDDLIQYMREKAAQGVDGFEPMTLLRQVSRESLNTASSMQKILARGFGRFAGGGEVPDPEAGVPPTPEKPPRRPASRPEPDEPE